MSIPIQNIIQLIMDCSGESCHDCLSILPDLIQSWVICLYEPLPVNTAIELRTICLTPKCLYRVCADVYAEAVITACMIKFLTVPNFASLSCGQGHNLKYAKNR